MSSAIQYKIQNVRTPAHMMRFKSFSLDPIEIMIDGLLALDNEYGPGGTPSFAEHIGEYKIPVTLACDCDMNKECPACNGYGEYTYWVDIPWYICTRIYERMALSAAKEA